MEGFVLRTGHHVDSWPGLGRQAGQELAPTTLQDVAELIWRRFNLGRWPNIINSHQAKNENH